MSQEKEQTRNTQAIITAEEFLRDSLEKQRIILEAIKNKKNLHMLVEEVPAESATVKLLVGKNKGSLNLTHIVFTVDPKESLPKRVTDLESSDGLPSLLIYEPREDRQLYRFAQIGKYLPGFLDEMAPGARTRPIWIFRSTEEYRLQLPYIKIRYFGNLITANISSTAQPNFS